MKKYQNILKIKRPLPVKAFTRKRLFSLLEKSRKKSLVWITGPPGSGKTTLVSSYIEKYKLQNIWYQIDIGDDDAASFFYFMSIAAAKKTPHIKKPLPLLMPEYLHGIPTFSRRYFGAIYERFKPPFLLVFDNYQELPENSLFHRMISEAFLFAPEGFTGIIISRTEPPPAFTALKSKRLVNIISWKDLKFTKEESRKFIHQSCSCRIPAGTLNSINSRFDGWAAGLVLLSENLKTNNVEPVFLSQYMPNEIFNYFANEIFIKTDTDVREFLLKTSYLPVITVSAAKSLTNNEQAEQILRNLCQNNFFTSRYISQTENYQYHPLFREFLSAQSEKVYMPEQKIKILYNSAVIMEKTGHTNEAFNLFIEAGEWSEAAKLINRNAIPTLKQGRLQTIEGWIGMLPVREIENNPWLLYWLGVCSVPLNPVEARDYFEDAFSLFKKSKDPAGLFLSLSGIFDAIHFSMTSFRAFDTLLRRLYKLLEEYYGVPFEEIEFRIVNSILSALYLRQPQHPDFEKWEDRAVLLAQNCSDPNMKAQIYHKLVCQHLFSGNIAKASLLMGSSMQLLKSHEVTPLTRLMLKNDEGFYCWITGKFEEGLKAVNKGLELASETGIRYLDYINLGHGAALSMDADDMNMAADFLKRMQPCLESNINWQKAFYHFLKTWEGLLLEDLNTALFHSDLCIKYSLEAGMPHTEAISFLVKSCVMYGKGDRRKAEELLQKAWDKGKKINNKMIDFMCLLAYAWINFNNNNQTSALDYLRKGMSLGREQGYYNTFIWIPGIVTYLCIKALDAGIETEYVKKLVKKRNLMPDTPPVECITWPWKLKIFTLGRFEIIREEKPIIFSGKIQHKPLAILKALIASGNREVTEAAITDMLWPDSDGASAHSVFTTTISRLRKLLGVEQAVYCYDGKVAIDPKYCWIDIWALESILGKADELWQKTSETSNSSKIADIIENAVRIYKGPFLNGASETWTISMRERLISRLLGNIKRVGIFLEKSGDCERAVDFFKKGLEVDDLSEDFYQNIIKCYLKLGRKAEAALVYKRCHLILSSVLGIEPSAETKALCGKI